MPTSRPDHRSYLCNQVLKIKPKSILDVGIGFGGIGISFREYTDIWAGRYNKEDWKTTIHGVEIFEEYITELQEEIYTHIYTQDAIKYLKELHGFKYDLIYAGDILEHFTREDGLKFIELLKEHGTHIIIATPVKMYPQGEVFNNKYEKHQSQWTKEDFKNAQIVSFGNTMVVNIDQGIQKYYCQSMKFYGDKLPFKFYDNPYSKTFFLGLYFLDDYLAFFNHSGERIVFWNGSDVTRLIQNPMWLNYLEKPAKHYCHNEQLQDELLSLGIGAEIMPIFFGDKEDYKPVTKSNMPVEVFMNAHPGREEEYGEPTVLNLACKFPGIKFHIYGIDKGIGTISPNVIYHGQIKESVMDKEIAKYHAVLRLNKHDGMSQIVCKASLLGLYPIVTSNIEKIKKSLRELSKAKHPYNFKDSDTITDLKELKQKLEV